MFSNDRNVETIAQLVEIIKDYIGLQTEYVKLDVIEKVVKLLAAIGLVTVFVTLFLVALIYFSFAAVYALQTVMGTLIGAFLVIGAFYLALIIILYWLRHRVIERPLVKFLASLLLSK